MKRCSKMIPIVLAGCMTFSMAVYAQEPAPQPSAVTIAEVAYGENYIPTFVTEDDTINSPSASSNVKAVTLSDGTVIDAEDGVLTLVIDGIQYDILDYLETGEALPEGYEFAVTAGKDTYTEPGKWGGMENDMAQYTYRSALKVTANGIDDSETIPSLLQAEYDETSIHDGSITSYGPFFNGIIIDSAPYTIENMTLVGIGDGSSDFQGEGAMIYAKGSADVTVENTAILTGGVVRTATLAQGSGILRLNNVVIYTEETDDTQEEYDALVVPMMKRTPFALGLEGVVRATNILGAGQGIYSNSLIVSSGWGVLSTDFASGYDVLGFYALDISDTVAGNGIIEVAQDGVEYFATKEANGVTYGYIPGGSGYVAYADSGVFDRFDHVVFYGGNEVQIMASSNSSAFYTNSELYSNHIGVMTQQNTGGTISIVDSVMNVGDTAVQIKSGAANNGFTNVVLDNTEINFTADSKWGKTLVELVESDDAGNPGVTTFTVDDNGDTATSSTAMAFVDDSSALLKNGEYTGNIWNNIYNKYQTLNVTLDAATVNGAISSSYGYHLNEDGSRMENGTVLHADATGNYLKSGVTDYQTIGAQYNVANEQVNNPLNLTLTNGSAWNVVLADGTCGEADAIYLNDLTVEEGSVIASAEPVEFHIYGECVIDGEISENITIVQEEASVPDIALDEIYAYDLEVPKHTATFKFVDEEGNPVSGAGSFEGFKVFGLDVFFTLGFNGYEMVSMELTDGDAVLAPIAEGEEGYGEYADRITMNTDSTVVVTVRPAADEGDSSGDSGDSESAGESAGESAQDAQANTETAPAEETDGLPGTYSDGEHTLIIADDLTFSMEKTGQNMEGQDFTMLVTGTFSEDGTFVIEGLYDGEINLEEVASEEQMKGDYETVQKAFEGGKVY